MGPEVIGASCRPIRNVLTNALGSAEQPHFVGEETGEDTPLAWDKLSGVPDIWSDLSDWSFDLIDFALT
jgi:hypothetical protein